MQATDLSRHPAPTAAPAARWRQRRGWGIAVRVLATAIPALAAAATGLLVGRALPRSGGVATVGWWAAVAGASLATAIAVERVARRLLPLSTLLNLSLAFPDRAPSRFVLARQAGSPRVLRERIDRLGREGIDPEASKAAETVLTLVSALAMHDRRTRGHSERVRAFTDLLADEVGISAIDRDRLRWSALLHDIGKLRVPARILNKRGKPTDSEWSVLKSHPEVGAELLAPLLSWLGEWGGAVSDHHERFDGGGYPRGLRGHGISLAGRIVCLTDAYETMTSARPYSRPKSVFAARRELVSCAGTQFDPVLVREFLNISLARLWRVTGVSAWFAQIPFLGRAFRATQQLSAAAEGSFIPLTVAAGLGVGTVAATSPGMAGDRIGDRPPAERSVAAPAPLDPPRRRADPGMEGGGSAPDGSSGDQSTTAEKGTVEDGSTGSGEGGGDGDGSDSDGSLLEPLDGGGGGGGNGPTNGGTTNDNTNHETNEVRKEVRDTTKDVDRLI